MERRSEPGVSRRPDETNKEEGNEMAPDIKSAAEDLLSLSYPDISVPMQNIELKGDGFVLRFNNGWEISFVSEDKRTPFSSMYVMHTLRHPNGNIENEGRLTLSGIIYFRKVLEELLA